MGVSELVEPISRRTQRATPARLTPPVRSGARRPDCGLSLTSYFSGRPTGSLMEQSQLTNWEAAKIGLLLSAGVATLFLIFWPASRSSLSLARMP
jgi:hypothetical protein